MQVPLIFGLILRGQEKSSGTGVGIERKHFAQFGSGVWLLSGDECLLGLLFGHHLTSKAVSFGEEGN
jgi:hypothetical protein